MRHFNFNSDQLGLLVSVRSANEACAALAGGADVIDVKEPSRGALGAADATVIAEVVAAVGERASISVAVGELLEVRSAVAAQGVAYAKLGLAGCRPHVKWAAQWRAVIAEWPATLRPVAVVYADWEAAAAPPPAAVLAEAIEIGCPAILVDTWDKSRGTLFDYWPAQDVAQFCDRAQEVGIGVVLAGSLQVESLEVAVACRPNLIGVRGAACDGGRLGTISAQRVEALWQALLSLAVGTDDRVLSPQTKSSRSALAGRR